MLYEVITKIVPATSGMSATATISDIAGEVGAKYMTLNGVMYEFGTFAVVNGNIVDSKYEIQTGDIVSITVINKLSELLSAIDFDATNCKFQKGKVIINADYYLCENDVITSFKVAPKSEPIPAPAVTQSIAQPVEVHAPQPEIRNNFV